MANTKCYFSSNCGNVLELIKRTVIAQSARRVNLLVLISTLAPRESEDECVDGKDAWRWARLRILPVYWKEVSKGGAHE